MKSGHEPPIQPPAPIYTPVFRNSDLNQNFQYMTTIFFPYNDLLNLHFSYLKTLYVFPKLQHDYLPLLPSLGILFTHVYFSVLKGLFTKME